QALPLMYGGPGSFQPQQTTGSLHFYLLPFMEGQGIVAVAGVASYNARSSVVKGFICPSDSTALSNAVTTNGNTWALTNYSGNIQVFDPQGTGDLVTGMP